MPAVDTRAKASERTTVPNYPSKKRGQMGLGDFFPQDAQDPMSKLMRLLSEYGTADYSTELNPLREGSLYQKPPAPRASGFASMAAGRGLPTSSMGSDPERFMAPRSGGGGVPVKTALAKAIMTPGKKKPTAPSMPPAGLDVDALGEMPSEDLGQSFGGDLDMLPPEAAPDALQGTDLGGFSSLMPDAGSGQLAQVVAKQNKLKSLLMAIVGKL